MAIWFVDYFIIVSCFKFNLKKSKDPSKANTDHSVYL